MKKNLRSEEILDSAGQVIQHGDLVEAPDGGPWRWHIAVSYEDGDISIRDLAHNNVGTYSFYSHFTRGPWRHNLYKLNESDREGIEEIEHIFKREGE